MVVYTCNPSIQEAELGRVWVQGYIARLCLKGPTELMNGWMSEWASEYKNKTFPEHEVDSAKTQLSRIALMAMCVHCNWKTELYLLLIHLKFKTKD
jgi:hypothetical protein